ncbi:MAG: permease-like cell division protein FtsX [Myxococcota bacterium]
MSIRHSSSGASALTVGTIAASLLVVGAYIATLQNLEKLALLWGRGATVTAYIADTQVPQTWESIRSHIARLEGVESATLVTPEVALERFQARGQAAAALVAGVDSSILQASIDLSLRRGFADLTHLEELASTLEAIPGITEADYGREEFERLHALVDVLRGIGTLVGLFIALATVFIISNTIRLTVYARRDEIDILRLVGATAWFVRIPFIIEGALWGIGGGGLAVLLLWLTDRLLAPRLSMIVSDILDGIAVHFFAPDIGTLVIIGGLVMGVVGSTLAVGRFLDEEST